jgi:hypothetical protein
MATHPNEFHLLWFDPGSAATGWAHFIIHCRAFARPERKITPNIEYWDCGEITGDDHEQYKQASTMAYNAHFNPAPYVARVRVGSEGYNLKQTIGSAENLLSPVRFNAVLSWEVAQHGLTLAEQQPSMRGQMTAERLQLLGFQGWPSKRWVKHGRGKDAFAAVQHAIVDLRRIKAESRKRPWKLSDGASANTYWDCECDGGKPCDITHFQDK